MPAAELAAAAAAEALANRHFPRLSDASAERETNDRGEASGESVGADSREASAAVVVAAAVAAAADESARAATPRRARGLSAGRRGRLRRAVAVPPPAGGRIHPGGSSRAESRARPRGGRALCGDVRVSRGAGTGPAGATLWTAAALPPLPSPLCSGRAATKGSSRHGSRARSRARLIARTTAGPSRSRRGHPRASRPPPRASRALRGTPRRRACFQQVDAMVATFFPETFGDREVGGDRDARANGNGHVLARTRFHASAGGDPPGDGGFGVRVRAAAKHLRRRPGGDLAHLEFGRHYHRVAIRRRYEYERAAQHAQRARGGGGGGGGGGGAPGAFGRNRRRKGDAATTRGLAAGDGFAAAAAAIAAGAGPRAAAIGTGGTAAAAADARNAGGSPLGKSGARRRGERESARETPPGGRRRRRGRPPAASTSVPAAFPSLRPSLRPRGAPRAPPRWMSSAARPLRWTSPRRIRIRHPSPAPARASPRRSALRVGRAPAGPGRRSSPPGN